MIKTIRGILPAVGVVLGLVLLPTMAFAASISSNLSTGSTGTDVSQVQAYLSTDASLYPEALVTGYYGALTVKAVTRFQAKYGIDQVGTVGPITRAKLNELMAGMTGTTGGTTGGTSTGGGDRAAPVVSTESVSQTNTTATIRWTTSEPATSRIMYGTVWPFLFASAPVASDGSLDTSTDITLTGLNPNTLYYYVRDSFDAFGNEMQTVVQSFRTNN